MLFVFIVCQVEGYRNILNLACSPLAFTSNKAFLKSKRRCETSLPASFSAWFSKKNIFLVLFYQLTKFHYLVAFISWDIGQYVYCKVLLTRLWLHRFWNYPYLCNQAVFPKWPKNKGKNLNILRMKRAFKMKYKAFFIISKGLSLK